MVDDHPAPTGQAGRVTAPSHRDPAPVILATAGPALAYFVRRDLLGEPVPPADSLWSLPAAARLFRRQRADGGWAYPGRRADPHLDYDLLETFRALGILVEQHACDAGCEPIRRAAEFVFAHQAPAGDFRGIYGAQVSTTYSPALTELLVKAGYADDPRIARAYEGLLGLRQDDGGWTIPCLTTGRSWAQCMAEPAAVGPERARPSSHLATGNVLRAFAAHPGWRTSEPARAAGRLLAARIFKRDRYPGREAPAFWERISFPFWFTDVVSVLDSLAWIGIGPEEPGVAGALAWLAGRQRPDGTFDLKLLRAGAGKETAGWVALAVGRVWRRYAGAR